MPELILEPAYVIESASGAQYRAQVQGQQRADGTWEGWIVFTRTSDQTAVLRTDRETTQATRAALAYWASGLEPVYYEGALTRARTLR